jgi:hypothetical protein
MRRSTRALVAALAVQMLAVVAVSCGVPTGDATFEEIDGEVLGGLNDPTTTTTTTTTIVTTTIADIPDPALETTTTVAVTEPPPPVSTVTIYFISRQLLSPSTVPADPSYGLNELVVLLEGGPPDDSIGQRLETFVEPGLIIGTPTSESGVIQVELDGDVFDEIAQRNQRQALAQIVVTLLENTPAVGQVSFTIDDRIVLIPTDGGSKEAASVDDFRTLRGVPRSSNEPPDDTVDVPDAGTTIPQ